MVIKTAVKLNKVPLTLLMAPAEIAAYINQLKSTGAATFGISDSELAYHIGLVEQAFYRLQSSETERIEIMNKMPKKRDHTFKIGAVYPIQVFDALFITNNEFSTISKLQFYAKAINGHTAELRLYTRKE